MPPFERAGGISVRPIQDDIEYPRTHMWNVNVQREVLSGTSVTLAYVGSHGDRLQRQRDTNPVTARTLPPALGIDVARRDRRYSVW